MLDRYFLSVDVLRLLHAEENQLVTLITKAKKSVVAYEKPPVSTGKRGPAKCKGSKMKLTTLFESRKEDFGETFVIIYGKQQPVSYYALNALWGKGSIRNCALR